MLRVIIESPFKATNPFMSGLYRDYLREAIFNSLRKNEAPFASHGFYTYFLNDAILSERIKGMEAGFAWGKIAEKVAVYYDLGISKGMAQGIIRARQNKIPIEFRKLWRG